MPIRNLFARRPGPIVTQDENQRPGSAAGSADTAHSGFEKVDTVGSKASSAFSIRSRKSQDTGEYKMSGMCCAVNGVLSVPLRVPSSRQLRDAVIDNLML